MISFSEKLLHWYDQKTRGPMPWRGEKDLYRVWLSEVMLQQTQVETVIPYYQRWLQQYPTVKAVAKASQDDILKSWEGLGYYARARNFHAACQQVEKEHGGKIPETPEEFSKLKGIGSYTLAAVQSIALNRPLPAIDGNVKRVVARLKRMKEAPSKALLAIETFLKSTISHDRPGDFNQAMMDLGATICKSTVAKCDRCPVKKFCGAFKCREVHLYPVLEEKPFKPHYKIAVGIVWKGERVLITKRKAHGLLGGLWEFPGGKIKEGETAKHCAKREVKEEVGVMVQPLSSVGTIKHVYTHFSIEMEGILCRYVRGQPKTLDCADWKWINFSNISSYAFPKANHKLFPLIPKIPNGPKISPKEPINRKVAKAC